MRVDREAVIDWAEKKFGQITVTGDEIKVNDPWWVNTSGTPDKDQKCWVNLSKCCFRAFKSGRTGHLIEFVMATENCPWDEAIEIVGGEDSLGALESKLKAFLGDAEPATEKKKFKPISLPNKTLLISSLPTDSKIKKWALDHLHKRRISITNLMVCLEGKYKNRIVIPYYGQHGELIYFNTRALSDKAIRYLGPPSEEFGIGKGDVIWMSKWPADGEKIYLTEGEFDAMVLTQCGLHGAACGGKSLSPRQLDYLQPYRVALAFDSDKAGKDVFSIAKMLMDRSKLMLDGKPRITIIRSPKQFKDWNDFYKKHDAGIIKAYIQKFEQVCTEDTLSKMQFQEL